MRSEKEIRNVIKCRTERIKELQTPGEHGFYDKYVVINMHKDRIDALMWVLEDA